MFKNKIALVTGGGRGIGSATVLAFARANAHVIACSRSEAELAETVKLATANGGTAQSYVCDISDEEQVVGMFTSIEKEYGRLDVLINNAAIFIPGLVEKTSAKDFRRTLDVNCTGMFLCCREAFRLMKKNGGRIVNISSLAGMRGVEKFPGFGSYAVSKFGVVGLTEVLAVEGKEYGIRVNALSPGAVDTEMLNKAAPDLYPRLSPEDVAKTILFLAGPDSKGVTGSTLEMYSHLLKE